MTTMWQAPAIVAAFMWLHGPADTLDRAARREALRRSVMPQSIASLSIYDWPPSTTISPVRRRRRQLRLPLRKEWYPRVSTQQQRARFHPSNMTKRGGGPA